MAPAGSREERGRDGQSGFTLIEMIVVLVIIALVLALVVPNIGRSTGRYAVAATAYDVAAAMRLARDRAIVESRPTRFLANADAFGPGGDRPLQHVPRGIALTVFGDDQGESGGRGDDIRFFPDGSSSGGRVDVTDGAAHYSVSVEWINGDVSIQSQRSAQRH